MIRPRPVAAGFALVLATATALAEDLTTVSGRTIRDVRFGATDDDAVQIQHRDGSERVYFYDLPEAAQRKLGFDVNAALRRKSLEVERLRAELATAKGQATKAVAEVAKVTAPRKPELWENRAPTPPAPSLPALKEHEVVQVFDLVNHYKADAPAADVRYRKKNIRLDAIIERMEEEAFSRAVKLVLESPDRTVRVVCTVTPPDRFRATYTKAEGTVMVANDGRSEFTWLKAGQRIIANGQVSGLKDGVIHLSRCEIDR